MTESSARRALAAGFIVCGTAAVAASVGALTSAVVLARRLVTPERDRRCDSTILGVDVDRQGAPQAVLFAPTVESLAPGWYGLFWDDESGHARIGDVLSRTADGAVLRRLDGLTRGALRPGAARWSGYYVDGSPQDAYGIPTENIVLHTENGPAPAWVTRGASTGRWAVLVHGRGARRTETVRAVPVLSDLGISTVIPTYRNDPDGPPSSDRRYSLGLTEWRDIEVAVQYALAQGAERIDLLGWSMGGAIVLQFLARSEAAGAVAKVFLDGPVLDWADVMEHHARLHRLPACLASLAVHVVGRGWGRRLVGVDQALDLRLTDWVARADELTRPMTVIHSVDDEFVPVSPTRRLARMRPDLVTWHRWEVARHVREWNVDPQRWEHVLRHFLID